jgi:CBS domain-containing protein
MPIVEKLIIEKNEPVATLPPDATVLDAAQLMNERHIGSVVVVDGGRLVGIFTERDVLRRIVAATRDPAASKLEDVMTTQVACATPKTRLDEIRTAMREKRIRHMPVVDGERVVGMVSIGDLNKVEHDVQERTIEYLERYMSVS